MAQLVKNLPALQETCIQSLSREDPLEKETATHCSILAWRTPWTEEPGGLPPWVHKELDTTERLTLSRTKLNEKGNIQITFKGVLYCYGELVWPKSGGIYCENK